MILFLFIYFCWELLGSFLFSLISDTKKGKWCGMKFPLHPDLYICLVYVHTYHNVIFHPDMHTDVPIYICTYICIAIYTYLHICASMYVSVYPSV